MEIKVAQNFVLNFLYNKLPRRRVNLFGEELELALVDKFADHWYPDKPFKGSAFRCLRVTDPNDPVLNRAARESGNPVSDIIENLPADLAIWIDPGEVSYRIGEKGSVKILYSESDGVNASAGSAPASGGSGSANGGGHGGMSPGLQTSSSTSSGASDDLNAEIAGYLPIDNLNSAMSALSCSQHPPQQQQSQQIQQQQPSQIHSHLTQQQQQSSSNGLPPQQLQQQQQQQPQQQPQQQRGPLDNSRNGREDNSNPPPASGFTPFQPRAHHQPVTYTAGSFAQTKFGSTKLKTNGKKTNRMSPTEFSNYIKQRALQKQNSNPGGGHFGGNNQGMRSGPFNGGFRPLNSAPISNNMGPHGFFGGGHQGHGAPQISPQGNNGHNMGGGNLNFANGGHHNGGMGMRGGGGGGGGNQNNDPFFFPLFPDRGGNNSSSGGSSGSSSANSSFGSSSGPFQHQSGPHQLLGGGTNNGPKSANSNPWSYSDSDTEAFLHDILTVGLNNPSASGKSSLGGNMGNNRSFGSAGNGLGLGGSNGIFFSDGFGSGGNNGGNGGGNSAFGDLGAGLAGNLLSDRFPCNGLEDFDRVGGGGSKGLQGNGDVMGGLLRTNSVSGGGGNANGQGSDKYQQQQRVLVAN